MSSVISGILAGSSSLDPQETPAAHSFVVRDSPSIPDTYVVHQAGVSVEAPPLLTVTTSVSTTPNIILYQGVSDPRMTIGTGRFSSFSSKTELSLRGQSLTLKTNSTDYNVYSPMGKFKWKPSKMGGSSMRLVDMQGTRLAQFKSAGLLKFGEKRLDIFMPSDGFFVEMVVLTATTARKITKMMEDAGLEVAGAVATA